MPSISSYVSETDHTDDGVDAPHLTDANADSSSEDDVKARKAAKKARKAAKNAKTKHESDDSDESAPKKVKKKKKSKSNAPTKNEDDSGDESAPKNAKKKKSKSEAPTKNEDDSGDDSGDESAPKKAKKNKKSKEDKPSKKAGKKKPKPKPDSEDSDSEEEKAPKKSKKAPKKSAEKEIPDKKVKKAIKQMVKFTRPDLFDLEIIYDLIEHNHAQMKDYIDQRFVDLKFDYEGIAVRDNTKKTKPKGGFPANNVSYYKAKTFEAIGNDTSEYFDQEELELSIKTLRETNTKMADKPLADYNDVLKKRIINTIWKNKGAVYKAEFKELYVKKKDQFNLAKSQNIDEEHSD